MGAEFQQFEAGQSMLLAWMLQALRHHSGGNVRSPAAEGLNGDQLKAVMIVAAFQQSQQPFAGFDLMAQSGGHHQVRQITMPLEQLINHWPAAVGQHSKFFAEGSTQINRKAGGVDLPQPIGLQRSPS